MVLYLGNPDCIIGFNQTGLHLLE
ncbi:uncharacterized protein ARMOST_22185 [Armillaria ostoyae]|uniref:Uncharacterized protein n=1 Tax=Armillaria ostoyae TaxID=47428 RepID=A0A284SC56_ARMOS|nr:uncharacterized protein ARMOST_22185 [Armillaria ostoyae]